MKNLYLRAGLATITVAMLACNLGAQLATPVAPATIGFTSTLSAATESPTFTLAASETSLPTSTSVPTDTPIPPPSNTPLPSNTPPPNIPDWPLTKQGAQGPNVFALQHLLRFHGHAIAVDGIFGPQTRAAVVAFQNDKGLSADGIVGPQTWPVLIQGAQVQQGSHGQPTRAVQTLLHSKFGAEGLAVDGIFGPQTDAAVRGFQQCHHLILDGIVGPQTWKALIAFGPVVC